MGVREISEFPSRIGQTVAVYRAFDEFGNLLYVGISSNLRRRMSVHKQHSRWWDKAADITWERFPTRSEAAARESALIQELRPPFNVDQSGRNKGWFRGHVHPEGIIARLGNHVQFAVEQDGIATIGDLTRYTSQVLRALVRRDRPITIVDENGEPVAELDLPPTPT